MVKVVVKVKGGTPPEGNNEAAQPAGSRVTESWTKQLGGHDVLYSCGTMPVQELWVVPRYTPKTPAFIEMLKKWFAIVMSSPEISNLICAGAPPVLNSHQSLVSGAPFALTSSNAKLQTGTFCSPAN